MTCNSELPEIKQNILPHQTAFGRPYFCVRAFKPRLFSEVMHDLRHDNIFGDLEYDMHTVEYQRRVRRYWTRSIWVRKPTEDLYGGRTEIHYPSSMRRVQPNTSKHDSKMPPWGFKLATSVSYSNFVTSPLPLNVRAGPGIAARVMAGQFLSAKKMRNSWRTAEADNQWIVPDNPWLLIYYACHIMVDNLSAGGVVKYLYKYCLKDPAFVPARIAQQNREREAYRSVRYVSSSEAVRRLCASRTRTASLCARFMRAPLK